ncbi:MAG: InlB B-repeat-containing protein [Myxococcaceae bacterium]
MSVGAPSKLIPSKHLFASSSTNIGLGLTQEQIFEIDQLLLKSVQKSKSGNADKSYQIFLGSIATNFTLPPANAQNPVLSVFNCAGALMSASGSCSDNVCGGSAAAFCTAVTQLSTTGITNFSQITTILNGASQNLGLTTPGISSPGIKITFHANGASGAMNTENIPLNSTGILNSNQFSNGNSIFEGWATSANGTVVYGDGASIDVTTDNIDLYPVWMNLLVNYDFTQQNSTSNNQVGNYNNGTNHGTTQSQLGPNSSYCASFNGSSSYIQLPDYLIADNNYNFTISMTFQTTQNSGVLLEYQNGSIGSGVGTFTPILYINSAGNLLAGMWAPIQTTPSVISPHSVTDGYWHTAQITLTSYPHDNPTNSTLSLTLDRVFIGTIPMQGLASYGAFNNQIGTGQVDDYWLPSGNPNAPTPTAWKYFDGCISNFSIYADQPNNPTRVTFDPNGGTGTMDAQFVTANNSLTLNANTFTRSNYTFIGWATSNNGARAYADSASITPSGNITLYALWSNSEVYYDFRSSSSNLGTAGSTDDGTFNGNNSANYDSSNGLSFDGTSTYVQMPDNLVCNSNTDFQVTMTFKTSNKQGVLLGYQAQTPGETEIGGYIPILYIDTNGYLRANMWTSNNQNASINSHTNVADTNWHMLQLNISTSGSNSSATLYLDGVSAGSVSGLTFACGNLTRNQIGVGYGSTGRDEAVNEWDYFYGNILNFSLTTSDSVR